MNRALTSFLFLATLFSVSFEKIQWELAGTIGLAGILAVFFVASFAPSGWARAAPASRTVAIALLFAAAFLAVYLAGFYNIETEQAAAQFAKGLARFAITFSFAAAGIAYLARKPLRFYWLAVGALCAGIALNAAYGVAQLAFAETGRDLDQTVLGPLLGDARPINFYGSVQGADVYRPNALTNDPNHLGIVLLVPLLILTPLYLRLERGHPLASAGAAPAVPAARGAGDALAQRSAGTLVGARPPLPLRAAVRLRRGARAARRARAGPGVIVSRRVDFFETVVRSRLETDTGSTATHFEVYELIGPALEGHLLFGLGLNTFSVYYEAVTGLTNWGPHSFYAALVIETGIVGAALFAAFILWVFRRLRAGHRLGKALAAMRDPLAARVRPLAWGLTAAIVGVMAANAFYLTMQQSYFYALAMLALALPVVFGRRIMPGEGRRPRDVVPALGDGYGGPVRRGCGRAGAGGGHGDGGRLAGGFRHFGIAYGAGMIGNLRRKPWRWALVPAFLAAFARAARRAASDADLVHAHWLPSGLVAMATRKPFVVQLWGSDVELARRVPGLARAVLRRAEAVVCPSNALAGEATRLGAREIEVVPSGVDLPAEVGAEAHPPEVLFAGRLSPEKGVLELVEAAEG